MRRLAPVLLFALLATGPVGAGDTPLVVIVHPSRTDTIGLSDLAGIYLRKRRLWHDGAPIVPLNRESGSAARETFSVRVLGSDSAHLASYWNDAYFNGIFPPAVLSSSAAVKRYVANEPQAIGYIDPADVDDSVRVVLTLATTRPGSTAASIRGGHLCNGGECKFFRPWRKSSAIFCGDESSPDRDVVCGTGTGRATAVASSVHHQDHAYRR